MDLSSLYLDIRLQEPFPLPKVATFKLEKLLCYSTLALALVGEYALSQVLYEESS